MHVICLFLWVKYVDFSDCFQTEMGGESQEAKREICTGYERISEKWSSAVLSNCLLIIIKSVSDIHNTNLKLCKNYRLTANTL